MDTNDANSLPLPQIAAYLRGHGWERVDSRDDLIKWRLQHAPGGRSLVMVANAADPDYQDFLKIVLARLQDVEQRDTKEIVADIVEVGRDTFKLRVAGPHTGRGEVPVSYGTELFAGVRDLLVASGRSVGGTRANFAGPTPDDVMQVMDRMTFGQTQRGSYVVTVRTAVEQQLTLDDVPTRPALERQTIARTLEAVAAARSAGTHLDDEEVIDDSIEHGLSAQLCRALVRIDPKTTGALVEMRANWAEGLPAPVTEASATVELHSVDFARVHQLAKSLSSVQPIPDFRLDGWIKKIEFDALFESRGVITVEVRHKHGRRRAVRLELEGSEFFEAQRLAGPTGHVIGTGTLEKAGRAWVLTDPKDLVFAPDIST